MYEEFFSLHRRPFLATPDASRFVPLEGHQGALDALAIACERGQGIGVLTGESGLGKSVVGQRLAFELQPSFSTVFLGHSVFPTRRAFLQAILFELHLPYDHRAEQELRLDLTTALRAMHSRQQACVLIVDEAHRLTTPLFDEIRLLTLIAEQGQPLVRVVLIGDRSLEEHLADPRNAAINQRVCCQVDLVPLTQAESLEYLHASLDLAGGSADNLFTPDALSFLAKAADGVPRCLNHLADHSLLLAYATERSPVTEDVVREALEDLKQLPLHWHDPTGGSEVYRGLSQSPPVEDSAVDLWSAREANAAASIESVESWDESAFHQSSAAVEIGSDATEYHPPSDQAISESASIAAMEQVTCLKDDWKTQVEGTRSEQALLDNVVELTNVIGDSHDSRSLGQVFAAQDGEFGAPSAGSFVVEEFARKAVPPEWRSQEPRDPESLSTWGESGDGSDADDESEEPVWNLRDRSWSRFDHEDLEFEEEPVVDRYVQGRAEPPRIGREIGASETHSTTPRPANRDVDDLRSATSDQSTSSASDQPRGGIIEHYSRQKPTLKDQTRPLGGDHTESGSAESAIATVVAPKVQDRHQLSTELLAELRQDGGIEEQIGADMLDLYLDLRETMLNRQHSQDSDAAKEAEEPRPTQRPVNLSPEGESAKPWKQPAHSASDDAAPVHPTDAIQRAYGRMFSELRRRRS
jgi:type II secretory pathway predicted ATPase ExeA